ncbi:Isopentenyl-diphosphate delta-isomerase [Melia azedarach]|uniref:Isopentenyl-diphosphate delta-isomerase n=1 Tax=Melia azedarach TaxID=155640 RepID=A0ACC1YPX8_MELAZ|nr:Isopentenyl-diphosphate delta-isomerase [Melia azedarach]
MAGIAIILDLWRKNPSVYSPQTLHSSGFLSATAAAASAAAAAPFASRFLFGSPKIPVAYCDAGAAIAEDYLSSLGKGSGNIFQYDSVKYTPKQYNIELKPLFSAFELRAFAMTSLRSFLMFYLPLLEPDMNTEADDDDFLQDSQEHRRVDLVVPFKKSVKQIVRETTVVTTRRVLERLAVHYVSQRMAWKLLKDVPKSATRKAQRGLPTMIYFFRVSRTTFRGHFLGVAASWIVQIGIEIYRSFSRIMNSDEESNKVDKSEEAKLLGKKVSGVTIRCGASLVFASIGAGIGATLVRPSVGQWIGCAVGDLAGPIVVSFCLDKALHLEF